MENSFEKTKQILATNIKHRRQKVGLSQEALALAAEVDRTYVSQIERGVGNPSLLILCRIAAVLGSEPVDLLAKQN